MLAWILTGLACVVVGIAVVRPSAVERETSRWLDDFHRVQSSGSQRLPDWPLSFAGQRELIRRFCRPELRWARTWESVRRRFPEPVRSLAPRLPMARDRAIALGPALIEIPKMPALRLAFLEAASDPNAANRRFAIQFATQDWPVPPDLLPWLERLAGDADPTIRSQVASALHGIPSGNAAVERLIAQLQADQVSVVREAARSPYRSDPSGDTISQPRSDAPNP